MAAVSGFRWLKTFMALAGIVIALLIWIGQKSMLGSRLEIIGQQAVNYSGDATEQDARNLGEALKEIGYFTGEHPMDVLLRKEKDEGMIVSFVVKSGIWDNAEMVENFRIIGQAISPSLGAEPLKVRLIDENLNTKKELQIEVEKV